MMEVTSVLWRTWVAFFPAVVVVVPVPFLRLVKFAPRRLFVLLGIFLLRLSGSVLLSHCDCHSVLLVLWSFHFDIS